jgi:hypothetical protein
MSAVLKQIESLQADEWMLQLEAKERALRDQLQILESWRVSADDSLTREGIELLAGVFRLRLQDLDWDKRHPGPKPATSSDELGYWREKGDELKAEREGEPMMGCECAWPIQE